MYSRPSILGLTVAFWPRSKLVWVKQLPDTVMFMPSPNKQMRAPCWQEARQYYVLDTEGTEEIQEDMMERCFKAREGGSSSDSESDRPKKEKKRKPTKARSQPPKKAC